MLRFLLSPAALLPDEHGRLGAVELIRNELVPSPGGGLRAQPTDERETIPAGLAFRAIGYRGIPLPGVPFDERSAVIPNEAGRVLDPHTGVALPGEYVVGWIKRGPSGVIGTNKRDAQETVDAILADLSPSGERNGNAPARVPPTSPATPTRPPSRSSCAPDSQRWSRTPAGRPSTVTSAPSASAPGARASSSPGSRSFCRSPQPNSRRACPALAPQPTGSSATLSPAGPVSSSGRAPDF